MKNNNKPNIPKIYPLSLIFLGYQETGKSTLICSLTNTQKSKNYNPTIGAELSVSSVETKINGKIINAKLHIIEFSGQKRFRMVESSHVKKADIIILVFNYNDQKSFDELKDIYYNYFGFNEEKPFCCLICNKIDCKGEENQELIEEAIEFCDKHDISFYYCCNFQENCTNFPNFNIFKNILQDKIIPSYFQNKNIII